MFLYIPESLDPPRRTRRINIADVEVKACGCTTQHSRLCTQGRLVEVTAGKDTKPLGLFRDLPNISAFLIFGMFHLSSSVPLKEHLKG